MISAVCVNHKNYEFLPPLINSLKNEGVEEIIIVDNSLDPEEEKKLKNLKDISLYFLKKNDGLGEGLNFGAEKAKGNFILFCNPDILFKDGSVQNLKKELKNFDAAGPLIFWDEEEEILLPYPYPFNFFNEFLRILFPELYKNRYLSYQFKIWKGENLRVLPLLSGSCFLIKRDVFEKVGGFDKNFFLYFEENDFFYRFKKMGFKANFVFCSKIVHFYKINKGENHDKFFQESEEKYKKKHFSNISLKILQFLKKKQKYKDIKEEIPKIEEFENFEGLISPFPDFIPSAYIKNLKNRGCFEEKMRKISFFEGYLGFLKGRRVFNSFKFKVK